MYDTEYQVAQVRVIFKLPYRFKSFQEPLAYIELFTPFRTSNDEDGIFIVKRSFHRGKRHSKVVPLSQIILGCHLVPEFGGCGNQWTSDTALEKGSSFRLNHFVNVFTYALFHHDKIF